MATPTISVIITCHGKAPELPAMLNCLRTQRKNETGAHSVSGLPFKYAMGEYIDAPEIIVTCDGPYDGAFITRDTILSVGKAQYKFIVCPKEGGVGHHTREPAIHQATGDFVVLTNCDNYFMAGWFDRLLSVITDNAGMIIWDCVNNLWGWTNYGGSKKHLAGNSNVRLGTYLKRGYIDLSCAAVKSTIARQIGFPFRDYEGDYSYLEACALECTRQGLEIKHLHEVLCVHN